MKLFVAVIEDDQESDASGAVAGELVTMPWDRCSDQECDCASTMVGLASGAATATFTVADLPHFTEQAVINAFTDGLARAGHIDPASELGLEAAKRFAIEHLEMAELLPEGGTYWAMHPPAA